MSTKEQVLARLDEVLAQADEALASGESASNWVDQRLARGFIARAEVVATDLLAPGHPYRTRLHEVTGEFVDANDLASAVGILDSLRADIAGGYMQRYADLVSAEVFGDFLEMADHLLQEGYKDPAASLVGAVLEDGLRRLAANTSLSVRPKDDLSALNNRLADGKVYNDFVRKQIAAWADVRNSADHGHFTDYEIRDVEAMAVFVRTFLGERLG